MGSIELEGDALELCLVPSLLQLLLPVVLKHLGLSLFADGASAELLGCAFRHLSRNFCFIVSVAFCSKFHDLVRNDSHVDRLVARLLTIVEDALENLVLLDRCVPFVLAKCLGKAVLALG